MSILNGELIDQRPRHVKCRQFLDSQAFEVYANDLYECMVYAGRVVIDGPETVRFHPVKHFTSKPFSVSSPNFVDDFHDCILDECKAVTRG